MALDNKNLEDVNVPKHIGIIMDGNTRWAKAHGFDDSLKGHEAGAKALENLIEHAARRGVDTLTVYALSTENLTGRAKREVKGILGLLADVLRNKVQVFKKNGVGIQFLGEMKALPQSLQKLIHRTVGILKNNNRIKLNIALNYGGRDEIVRMVQKLVKQGVKAAEVNEQLISQNLYTDGCSDPDLIIRTGGNLRLSNFLVWQCTYSELYFTDTYWPDFDKDEFDKAILEYSKRTRTYGKKHALESVVPVK